MPKLIRNENGGIFVELALTLSILFAFYAGTLAMHRAAARRFHAIIEHRNQAIHQIRKSQTSPKFLLSR